MGALTDDLHEAVLEERITVSGSVWLEGKGVGRKVLRK